MNEAPAWLIAVSVVALLSVVFGLAAWGLTAIDKLRSRRRALRLGCSCCGESSKAVVKLIAGPGVAICDRCTRLATERLAAHMRGEHRHRDTATSGIACSFCNTQASKARVLTTWPGGAICDHCLDTCRNILEADAQNSPDALPPA